MPLSLRPKTNPDNLRRARYQRQKLRVLTLTALLSLLLCSTTYAAANIITIGVYPWPENRAASYVWKQLLEQRGYRVKLLMASRPIVWAGVGKGNVDLDLEAWLPHTDKEKYAQFKDKVILIGPWYDKAWQGLAVPDYVDVKSISQLKSSFPKIAEWLSHFHLSKDQLSNLINLMRQSKSPEAGASRWLRRHKQVWQQWFKSSS